MLINIVPGKRASSQKIVAILSFIQHAFINQVSLEKLSAKWWTLKCIQRDVY